ncbi:MAG: hypothetical protein OEM52_13175 [bacterium]|nr:hypothetical protein [bacterium]
MPRSITEHTVRRLVVELYHTLPCNVRFKASGLQTGIQILLPSRKNWCYVVLARNLSELFAKLENRAVMGYFEKSVQNGACDIVRD